MNKFHYFNRVVELSILNALMFVIMLGCATVLEFTYKNSALVELSQDLEPSNGIETEFEKDVEFDDEIKKITHKIAIPNLGNKSSEIYFSEKLPNFLFNRIQLPPPEELFFS